ncbi:hypothetical protein BASA60_002396 [Batrachochytrium salamandrivorans]|nr:hypothetical protein BASA60_002396 [Batrachochytrium salamandrivorans]
MKFSTGIIISALAFNVFAETPTNISPGPLLDRRDAKPTMTDPLWKRNGEDDAEGSVPSPLRSDAEASGGRGRSGAWWSMRNINISGQRTSAGEVLAFGQKLSVAAGNKARRTVRGRAGKFIGQEITMLLRLSLQFTNMLVITNIRDGGSLQIPEKLLEEVGSKAPAGERKLKRRATL